MTLKELQEQVQAQLQLLNTQQLEVNKLSKKLRKKEKELTEQEQSQQALQHQLNARQEAINDKEAKQVNNRQGLRLTTMAGPMCPCDHVLRSAWLMHVYGCAAD